FAGTDGRKLVRYINRNVQPGVETGFILPKKVANIVKGLLQKEQEVTLTFDKERANIKTETFDLYFRMIEGNYPNYNAVIPTNNPFEATVDRASLISALKRVSVLCNQSTGLMKLQLDANTLTLSVQDYDFATSAKENLMCDYTNQPVSIGFNCLYMIEMASILNSDNVTLRLADPSRPGLMAPTEEPEGEETLTMLMPMMLQD
ncbi:MAG: DNA polymerase III subunit beta, partial [Bacteroidaceae bacterium]|nr:DNA polymerase III subunit beta [Bacteroidaceae bacterium]